VRHGPGRQQVIVRGGRRVRDVAEERVTVVRIALLVWPHVLMAGEQRHVDDALWSEAPGAGAEARLSRRQAHRELVVRSETVGRSRLVIGLDGDTFVGKVGLKMPRLARRGGGGAG